MFWALALHQGSDKGLINAWNISAQISLWWPNYVINSVDKNKHPVHMKIFKHYRLSSHFITTNTSEKYKKNQQNES